MLLIAQAHELEAVVPNFGLIGSDCFLDMHVTDQQQGDPDANLRVMRFSDQQEVRVVTDPRKDARFVLVVPVEATPAG